MKKKTTGSVVSVIVPKGTKSGDLLVITVNEDLALIIATGSDGKVYEGWGSVQMPYIGGKVSVECKRSLKDLIYG